MVERKPLPGRSPKELAEEFHHVTIHNTSRRDKIKEILGDNFVGLRQCGPTLDLYTKEKIVPGILERIERIWRNE